MEKIKSCNCTAMDDEDLDTYKKFEKAKEYFETQVKQGIFKEKRVTKPYYKWKSDTLKGRLGHTEYYATKWYKCRVCGCLWEFEYPDFPDPGFVRRIEDGKKYVPLEN